ncbi:MAG: efflux RND transporter periplasmic adaptor subunit [Candidatus Paceibacterota bacterium]
MPASILFRLNRFKRLLIAHWIIASIAALILVGSLWYAFGRANASYQFVVVARGSLTEIVSVTGNTTPVESSSLGFGASGIVRGVYAKVGDTVYAGSVLASLDVGDLRAQLAGAQATVDAEIAALHKLQAGATAEAVAVSKAQLAVAEQSLDNSYTSVSTTLADAYAKANDAVRNQLSSFFTNAETADPQMTFSISNFIVQNQFIQERVRASEALNVWKTTLTTLPTDHAGLDLALSQAATHLGAVRSLLSTAVVVSAETTAAYRTDAMDGLTEVNTALSALNTVKQSIAAGRANVAQLRAQLNATTASATPQDIEAEQARVKQAEANVSSIAAKLQNAQIVAPQNGVITQFDAKVGQVASLGTPLISLISASAYEVHAGIPETDIGKVAIGNKVSLSFDAFPGETFSGTIFYIDPAETITQGVVDYKIKISFDTADPRMKSGLTANLDVQTRQKDGVLVLPQYAILENDAGTFVQMLQDTRVIDVPVTLGLQDQNGNVEITSGVAEGDQVLNIGLKR